MPKIVIENLHNKELRHTYNSAIVLNILHENYIDWMHACGAKGRCTTCKMIVLEGSDSLHPLTEAEKHYLAQGQLKRNERLACQAVTTGDLKVRIPETSKLPHINYSS